MIGSPSVAQDLGSTLLSGCKVLSISHNIQHLCHPEAGVPGTIAASCKWGNTQGRVSEGKNLPSFAYSTIVSRALNPSIKKDLEILPVLKCKLWWCKIE